MTSETHRALAVILLSFGGVIATLDAAADTYRRSLTADDFYGVQTLSEPQVSPDGRWVAYILTANDRLADEPRSAVWMVSWDGEQRIPLTNPAKGIRGPRWSPDGRYLAFIAHPAGSESEQLMLLDRRGGDARAISNASDEIADYAWSPDGARLVLAMSQSDDGRAATGAGDGDVAKAPKPIVIDALHFKQDEDGYLGVGHERHLYLLDVASMHIEPLTLGPGYNEELPAWSPDGRRIAFVRTREMGPDADGREAIDIIDVRTGATPVQVARPFVPNRQSLTWTPDGSGIALLQGQQPKYNQYQLDQLAIVPVAGGPIRVLSPALDRAVKTYACSPDSRSITAIVEDDASDYPVRIDLNDGTTSRLIPGQFVATSLSQAAGHAALLYSDDTTPAEVYALEHDRLRKLTSHNDALLAELRLGAVDDLRFKSRDGTEIHGVMVRPPGFASGRRYPTIVWVHGGPNGQDAHALALKGDQFTRQLLAADGFVVLGVNYRGSGGRGSAFQKAIVADWGHKEVADLLAGVDHLVARGIADPARLAIGGWSYGAILTNYTIAGDRRFKAAFSGAGSANMPAMYGSDEYIVQYTNELGAPWLNTPLWLKLSQPFLHADRIHTPTLFMGGDKDFDVPLIGGEQMYQALRTLGVPTQLVIYPGESHIFARPSFLTDRAARMSAWFIRYLAPQS